MAGKKPKKLRAVRRKGGAWEIKFGNELLFLAYLNPYQRVFHAFPIPDTIEALESGRRYFKNLLEDRWQGVDPDRTGGEIKDNDLIVRLDSIRALCLPFPNIGDSVAFPNPQSGAPSRGIVLEVNPNKRQELKAWVQTVEGKRCCIMQRDLSRPEREVKSASTGV